MTLNRTFHNVYDAHYHIVFPVKYRKALLTEEIPRAISQIAEEIGQRYDIDFERIGYDLNHVHLLVSFLPKYGGSAIVRICTTRRGDQSGTSVERQTFSSLHRPSKQRRNYNHYVLLV